MKKELLLLGLMAVIVPTASAQSFGAADNFNLYALGNISTTNSDTEGRVAAGGNAFFQNYDIGLFDSGGDVLVVGGNINFSNGTIRGNARHGGSFSGTNTSFLNGGAAIPGVPINFATTNAALLSTSAAWGGLAANGTATQPFSTLILNGSNTQTNIFNINASQLSGIFGVDMNVPAGSSVLINVFGTSVNFPNIGYNYNGNQTPTTIFRNVVWNLPNATSVSTTSLNGTLLAPQATLTSGFGAINGQAIVGNFNGNMQVNLQPFTGRVVPEPATMTALALGAIALMRRRKKSA